MTELTPVVFVIDDDPSVRSAIKRLLECVGLQVETFGSAEEFLPIGPPERPSCLVLDVRLPGISGPDLQRQIANTQLNIPIIFISAYSDVPISERAMKAGAVAFLTKPFPDQDLLDAIQLALQRDRASARTS
jgi:FixJ family two-component response regulator